MPPDRRGGAPIPESAGHHQNRSLTKDQQEQGNPASPHIGCYTTARAVSWWSVHEHVAPLLDQVGDWPMAGTPAWCDLDDDDPVKLVALLDAARHWALHLEINQQALAEASRDVSVAADWRSVANEIRRRRHVYIPRQVVA